MLHVTDPARVPGHVLPFEQHPPAVRAFEPGEEVKEGGLADPADPKQGNELAALEGKADVLHHAPPVVAFTKPLGLQHAHDCAAGRYSLVKPPTPSSFWMTPTWYIQS